MNAHRLFVPVRPNASSTALPLLRIGRSADNNTRLWTAYLGAGQVLERAGLLGYLVATRYGPGGTGPIRTEGAIRPSPAALPGTEDSAKRTKE